MCIAGLLDAQQQGHADSRAKASCCAGDLVAQHKCRQAGGSLSAAPAAGAAAASPSACTRTRSRSPDARCISSQLWKGRPAERAALKGSTGSPEQRAASAGSQDNDDGDDDMGAEDWNDILAVWMQAVGMPQFVADSTSGSSFDGQSEPGWSGASLQLKVPPGCALHAHSCHAVELQCA